MKKTYSLFLALALVVFSSALAPSAHAVMPLKQGTMKASVERLVGVGLELGNGSANLITSVLPNGSAVSLQFPRAGFDYFIIDGLSLGGNAGLSLNTYGNTSLGYLIAPRIGYAFQFTDTIDLWARGGLGVYGSGNGNAQALLTGECMFLWNFMDPLSLEFGPALDIALGGRGIVSLGGNAGVVLEF